MSSAGVVNVRKLGPTAGLGEKGRERVLAQLRKVLGR